MFIKINNDYVKRFIILFLICTIFSLAHAAHRPYIKRIYRPYSPTYAGFVMEAKTGQILYQFRADQQLHPASLTKIMTLLMVFEELNKKKISLSDNIKISRHAASMAPSKLGLRAGSSITVKNAIYAVVTKSCNDIAVALAESIAGNERQFAKLMTERARKLGMTQTYFANASGLPHPKQLTTARDMARLARYVIINYPDYYHFYATKNFYYRGQLLRNHNNLMNSYMGMDGMKSGYIAASGFNLVASAVRHNNRLIGVVFGGKTANSRNTKMAYLLNTSFEILETFKRKR